MSKKNGTEEAKQLNSNARANSTPDGASEISMTAMGSSFENNINSTDITDTKLHETRRVNEKYKTKNH